MTYNVFGGTLNPAQSNPIWDSTPCDLGPSFPPQSDLRHSTVECSLPLELDDDDEELIRRS